MLKDGMQVEKVEETLQKRSGLYGLAGEGTVNYSHNKGYCQLQLNKGSCELQLQ